MRKRAIMQIAPWTQLCVGEHLLPLDAALISDTVYTIAALYIGSVCMTP